MPPQRNGPESLGGGLRVDDDCAVQAQRHRNSPAKNGTQDSSSPTMMKGEREELLRLVRVRDKALKSAAKQSSAEIIADFENQMASEYSFDDDAVWQEAHRLAKVEVAKSQERIAMRRAELPIPQRFAPGLGLVWHYRGYDNLIARRKAELRRVAQTRVQAMERATIVKIEVESVNAQTAVTAHELTSTAAHLFLEQLPSVESLMPAAGDGDSPIVEQLVSPGALRQRRYRERHRDAQMTQRGEGETHTLPKKEGER